MLEEKLTLRKEWPQSLLLIYISILELFQKTFQIDVSNGNISGMFYFVISWPLFWSHLSGGTQS